MCLVGQCVHAAGVDPSVVKVKQCACGDSEIDRFVIPTRIVQQCHILRPDAGRVIIHLVNKSEQGLVFFIQRGSFEIAKRTPDQFLASQQFRRNCGVRLQSKRTIVLV